MVWLLTHCLNSLTALHHVSEVLNIWQYYRHRNILHRIEQPMRRDSLLADLFRVM
jgi:hypothetical protein